MVIFRLSGKGTTGKDVNGDGTLDSGLVYKMKDSETKVEFPLGFCPGAKNGMNMSCEGSYGIVVKEWDTITRVRIAKHFSSLFTK